jgi:hypothetical protein
MRVLLILLGTFDTATVVLSDVGGTRFKHWDSIKGSNYVPSYSVNDVKDIVRPGYYDASIVDRELGYAKNLAINSLRVFMTHGAYASDNASYQTEFVNNYKSFQQIAKSHNLTLLITLGTGERSHDPTCDLTTNFLKAIVGAELAGTVIAYEADNEPSTYMFEWLTNCTLPALNALVSPTVDISVGLAHVGQVTAFKHLVTTLNWHSYNGKDNGGGLYGEIFELQKYVNKFNPPKQLVLTEYHARPAQPLAAAYPVIRDNKVAAYSWALIIVDCTTHWNRPLVPSDPPFQGLLWPNGTALDDIEEVECLRNDCRTLQYVHHCCNNWHANGTALDHLWQFDSHWSTKVFGSPNFKLPGPREGSMRWTNVSEASVTIGPLPIGTKRIALYLPHSEEGAEYNVQVDGRQISAGSTYTSASASDWVARTILSVEGGKSLKLVVGKTSASTQFSITGATFFFDAPQLGDPGHIELLV